MKVLVVDDEVLARERLRRMLEEFDGCSVCGEAATGLEALAMSEKSRPDVVLMDIRMPGMDGIEAARHLQAMHEPPAVIFTTAYSDHALEAFETHAVDYLLKPVRRERLQDALQSSRRLTRVQAASLQQTESDSKQRQRICARVRGNLELIPLEEIRYFQAEQKYVTVRTAENRYLIEETLKALEDEFSGQFVRIHRNALVALRYLAGLDRDAGGHGRVRLQGVDEELEVSRRHAAGLREFIKHR